MLVNVINLVIKIFRQEMWYVRNILSYVATIVINRDRTVRTYYRPQLKDCYAGTRLIPLCAIWYLFFCYVTVLQVQLVFTLRISSCITVYCFAYFLTAYLFAYHTNCLTDNYFIKSLMFTCQRILWKHYLIFFFAKSAVITADDFIVSPSIETTW